jgi:hypothetical protein
MKPSLLFVYSHPKPEWWQDGLAMALKELEKDFRVTRYNLKDNEDFIYEDTDFILGWGGFDSPADQFIRKLPSNLKKGLCLGGNATKVPREKIYDVIFHETDWVKENYLQLIHPKTKLVKAFGINNNIFYNIIDKPVWFDYLGIGALAQWKRWGLMAKKEGNRLVIGEYQLENEQESLLITRNLIVQGIIVSNQINPQDLRRFYNLSKICYIPANIYGGGERAVLEARACGCKVEVEDDNPKLKELLFGDIPSYKYYAKILKETIWKMI